MSRLLAALLTVLLVGCVGCGVTVYRDVQFDSGQERVAVRRVELGPRPDKAEVLAVFGPPGEILPQDVGDIFVYRMRRIDVQVWQINTGLVAAVAMPVYLRAEGRRSDDVLFVFFDREGQVRHVSTTWDQGAAP